MAKWLVKTEPSECSIDDFLRRPEEAVRWDGVRNYQARNFLKAMSQDDEVLVYHSSCKHIGVAGIVQVVREAYADPTQFDASSPYHDPKSPADNPRWVSVDMLLVRKFPALISLDELRELPGLDSFPLLKRGNRLSVMPVGDVEWKIITERAAQS